MALDRRQVQKLNEAYDYLEGLEKEDPELLEALKSIFTEEEALKVPCRLCGVMLTVERVPKLHYKYAQIREKEDGLPEGQKEAHDPDNIPDVLWI